MYSKLVPPSGLWKPSVFIDPIISAPVIINIVDSILTFNIKLSVYWQDFRLIIRYSLQCVVDEYFQLQISSKWIKFFNS